MAANDKPVSSSQHLPAWFWVTVYIAINVSLTILNKAVFQFAKFGYPMTLSMIHMFTSSLFSWISIHKFKIIPPPQPLDSHSYRTLALFSTLFCVNIVAGNVSLQFVTVSLSQVVRSSSPGITMILSVLFFRKKYSFPVILSMLPVIVGVSLATAGELDFHLFGFIILITGCVISVVKVILSNIILTGPLNLHPLDFLDRTYPLAGLQMLCLAFVFGEFRGIYENWHNLNNWSQLTTIMATGVMSFFLNLANFMTNKATSPLTLSVAGNLKQVMTIYLSVIIFNNPISAMNALGITIAVLGTIIYSYYTLVEDRKRKAAVAAAAASQQQLDVLSSTETPK